MRNDNKFTFIALAFVVFALITGFIYYKGRNRHPFRYYITDEVQQWLKEQNDAGIIDTPIKVQDHGPYDFSNKSDLGATDDKWGSISDDCFIVYYEGNNMENNAKNIIQEANRIIPDLKTTMGKFYYPSDVLDNRKLPIYLAASNESYDATICRLFGDKCNTANTSGMTVCTVSSAGTSVEGIVLHPDVFSYSYGQERYRKTLRHEMNHYVFYLSSDFSKVNDHPDWVIEGIAKYFEADAPQISDADSIKFISKYCKLDKDFPENNQSQYWAGASFYKFVADSCGINEQREFLNSLYSNNLEVALHSIFPDSVDVKNKWTQSLVQSMEQKTMLTEEQ